MNTHQPSSDPLLESLAGEAADLPIRAASEARQRIARRRQNRQRSALLAGATLVGIVTWNAMPSVPNYLPVSPESGLTAEHHAVTPAVPQSLPTGLDPEQTAFIREAGDIPLLLVRNSAGQVTRIHLIER